MRNVDIEQIFNKQIGNLGKKYRRIFGRNETNERMINQEVLELYSQRTITAAVKLLRIHWLYHCRRFSESRPSKIKLTEDHERFLVMI